MQTKTESNGFANACFLAVALSLIFVVATLLVYYLLPSSDDSDLVENEITMIEISEEVEEPAVDFQNIISEVSFETFDNNNVDNGLEMYRQPLSRSATEWFYYQITGDRDVTQAILTEADKNDIPLSLAFALAYTESSYKVNAINKNTNQSIDRGLFQLNNNSFPDLTEEDFFDPYTSAKYGMSHLRFCLNTAGNEVAGLAMYNAGTGRVRSNKTPQSTLNYVGKILAYQDMLDQLFEEQICTYFEPHFASSMTVAMQQLIQPPNF